MKLHSAESHKGIRFGWDAFDYTFYGELSVSFEHFDISEKLVVVGDFCENPYPDFDNFERVFSEKLKEAGCNFCFSEAEKAQLIADKYAVVETSR